MTTTNRSTRNVLLLWKGELIVIAIYFSIAAYFLVFFVVNPNHQTGFLRDFYKLVVIPVPVTMIAMCVLALFAPLKRFWIFFGTLVLAINIAALVLSGLRIGFDHPVVYYVGIISMKKSLVLAIPTCLLITIYQQFWGIRSPGKKRSSGLPPE